MAHIRIVDPAQATGKSKELLTALQNNIKSVPNLAKALANSLAALKAWMEFDGALAKGSLNAKLRQEIALAVGQKNGCEYCVSTHTVIGKLTGLTDQQILSRQAQGTSPKATAALAFSSWQRARRWISRVVQPRLPSNPSRTCITVKIAYPPSKACFRVRTLG